MYYSIQHCIIILQYKENDNLANFQFKIFKRNKTIFFFQFRRVRRPGPILPRRDYRILLYQVMDAYYF